MKLTPLLASLGLVIISSTASAAMPKLSDAEIRQFYEKVAVTIDGNVTPDLVPFHLKANHFLLQYDVVPDLLGASLKKADKAVLASSKKDTAAFMEKQSRWLNTRYTTIVSGNASTATPLQLAALLDELEQDNGTRLDAYYQGLFKKLSPAGQKLVSDFIQARVHPTFVTVSNTAVAAAAPDYFLEDVKSRSEEILAPPTIASSTTGASPQQVESQSVTTSSSGPGVLTTLTPPVE